MGRLLRRILPFISIAVFAAVLYDGWIFYSRWRSIRDGQDAEKAEEARRAKESIDRIGGTTFRIINFYASPQSIHPGERVNLCYGVYGAKAVRIEPTIGDLHPAISDCRQVTPTKDTTYKLMAEDAEGHSVAQEIEVHVR
jgi:hypothetical protein